MVFNSQEFNLWFEKSKRQFPWRDDRSPYRVWISEVMLQQTRAEVVVGYFERWMQRFPTIKALAEAPFSLVLKYWEGLGYYQRVRSLHKAAELLIKKYQGKLPSSLQDLKNLPGIGSYTAGAILAFGFQKKAAAVDGNVLRVLCRHFGIYEDVSKVSVKTKLEKLEYELLFPKEPWITTEAFIELGAIICRIRPLCRECPLRSSCFAYRNESWHLLPLKSKKVKTRKLMRLAFVMKVGNKILLKKGEKGKVMADLYEFPYIEVEKVPSSEQIREMIYEQFAVKPKTFLTCKAITHSFTHHKVWLYPYFCELDQSFPMPGFTWVDYSNFSKLAFSAGHRKIVMQIKEFL